MAKRAKATTARISTREAEIGHNVGALSGVLKTIVENHEAETTAFVRLYDALGRDDEERMARIATWPALPESGKEGDMPQDKPSGRDWYLVHVIGATPYGKELIVTSTLPADTVTTAEQRAAADRAKRNLRHLLKVVRQVKKVGDQADKCEAHGIRVRLTAMGGVKTYKPIRCTSHPGNAKQEDNVWYSVPDFLKLRPANLSVKTATLQQLESTRVKTTRKKADGGSGNAGADKATQTDSGPAVPAYKSWPKEVVPALQGIAIAVHPETLRNIAPAIAKDGLSPKSPDYDDAFHAFSVLGRFLTYKNQELTAAFDAFVDKLPKPITDDKEAPEPEKAKARQSKPVNTEAANQ